MHKHQDQHCVKMRENTDQNSSEQRHLCSVGFLCRLSMQILLVLLNGSPVFIEPFVCSNFFSLILASHRMSRCSLSRKKSLVFGKFTVVLFQHHQEWYFVFLYFLFFFSKVHGFNFVLANLRLRSIISKSLPSLFTFQGPALHRSDP